MDAAQTATMAATVLLTALSSVLLWQVRSWVAQQRALSAQIGGLQDAIASLRLELAQQRADERDRSDESARRIWRAMEARDEAVEARLRDALKEHRETCRAAQDAITGVGSYPIDGRSVP